MITLTTALVLLAFQVVFSDAGMLSSVYPWEHKIEKRPYVW